MFYENNSIMNFLLSIILFPTYLQEPFINFAWGVGDETGLMLAKRFFLLLPALAIILGCWLSVASIISVIFRHNRREFVLTIFITWWDLGKSIVSFWGGIFKFLFYLAGALIGLGRIMILAVWSLIQEIVLMPFRLLHGFGRSVATSTVPWIAVFLTMFWCLIESTIFTYVTTPLVIDTFSNITGEQLSENFIRIPLFTFLLFIVLGSYAVLSTFVDSAKNKNITAILGIGVIEIIVLLVEVVFLYREFVDSLVPWLAQYSDNFELGIFWTLAIATFAWFGIRSLSWFLFAAHGTPTIMSIIQGKGLQGMKSEVKTNDSKLPGYTSTLMEKVKKDADWIQEKGEQLLGAFMLPPLQVVAASINFCTLLVTGKHLFELPFRSINDIVNSRVLIENVSGKKETLSDAKPAFQRQGQ